MIIKDSSPVIIRLSDDEKSKYSGDNNEENLSGVAILLRNLEKNQSEKELFLLSNTLLRRMLQEIDSSDINSNDKDFLIRLNLFLESLYNSTSLRGILKGESKDIESFDRYELKEKLMLISELL